MRCTADDYYIHREVITNGTQRTDVESGLGVNADQRSGSGAIIRLVCFFVFFIAFLCWIRIFCSFSFLFMPRGLFLLLLGPSIEVDECGCCLKQPERFIGMQSPSLSFRKNGIYEFSCIAGWKPADNRSRIFSRLCVGCFDWVITDNGCVRTYRQSISTKANEA